MAGKTPITSETFPVFNVGFIVDPEQLLLLPHLSAEFSTFSFSFVLILGCEQRPYVYLSFTKLALPLGKRINNFKQIQKKYMNNELSISTVSLKIKPNYRLILLVSKHCFH